MVGLAIAIFYYKIFRTSIKKIGYIYNIYISSQREYIKVFDFFYGKFKKAGNAGQKWIEIDRSTKYFLRCFLMPKDYPRGDRS